MKTDHAAVSPFSSPIPFCFQTPSVPTIPLHPQLVDFIADEMRRVNESGFNERFRDAFPEPRVLLPAFNEVAEESHSPPVDEMSDDGLGVSDDDDWLLGTPFDTSVAMAQLMDGGAYTPPPCPPSKRLRPTPLTTFKSVATQTPVLE